MRAHRALLVPTIPAILSLLACLGGAEEDAKPAYAGLQQLTVVNALAMEDGPAAVDMWIIDDGTPSAFAEGVALGTASAPAAVLVTGGAVTVRLTAAGADPGAALVETTFDTDGDDAVLIAHPVESESGDSDTDPGGPGVELVPSVAFFDMSEPDTVAASADRHRLHLHLGGVIGAVGSTGLRVGWSTPTAGNCTAPLEAADPVHQLNPPAGEISLGLYGATDDACAQPLAPDVVLPDAAAGDATLLIAWGRSVDSIAVLDIDLTPPEAEE